MFDFTFTYTVRAELGLDTRTTTVTAEDYPSARHALGAYCDYHGLEIFTVFGFARSPRLDQVELGQMEDAA